jgi:hypothetical protein
MKPITIYESNDGTRYGTPEAARRNDDLIEQVKAAVAPLGERPDDCDFTNGHGWLQHDPQTIRQVKLKLIEISRPLLGEWMDLQEKTHGVDLSTVDSSWFSRMLDGDNRPLERAWKRIGCITPDGREVGQIYYASRMDQVKGGRLN